VARGHGPTRADRAGVDRRHRLRQTRITREDSWEDKLIHDLEYIADRSIRLYLRVLGATMVRIIRLTFSGRNR
jgi:lipopolysaccharide/colanic/teichoic acid biosynthesis glycosyltransferase